MVFWKQQKDEVASGNQLDMLEDLPATRSHIPHDCWLKKALLFAASIL